ncbi:MAG TPA: discoidin domain-containing protein [Pyrinomonadaceae bacterium]|nr:discoidin domain-containing protein [Pyrinomonadaceae bacterium]
MKRCLKCNREYVDDTLRFCLDDGTPLSEASYRSEAPATQVLHQRTAANFSPSIPTIPSYSARNPVPSEQHQVRRSNPILIAGVIAVVLLLAALVALAGYFVFKQTGEEDAAKTNTNQSETPRKKSSPADGRNSNEDPSPEPTEPKANTPMKITASASSVRLAVQSNTYYAENAIDGKRTTAWIEGGDGAGTGEWIRFDFDREINLHRILFQPGYFKSSYAWGQNNRLASVTAQFSDGSSRELTFADRMESQKIDVGNVRTRWVKFVINSVYYGTDPDTALSEIAFEWDQ